jgi:hypothetical protein
MKLIQYSGHVHMSSVQLQSSLSINFPSPQMQ